MKALRRWSALLAAAISLALGAASLFHPDRALPRAPAWEAVIAPLADAPIPSGAVVAFLAQAEAGATNPRFLLLEAAWRRPDVHWSPLSDFPSDSRIDAVVTTDARPAPPGWRQVWSSGQVRLLRRASP